MNNLQTKRAFFESQIDYYKMYVQACLANMLSAGKRLVTHKHLPATTCSCMSVSRLLSITAGSVRQCGFLVPVDQSLIKIFD